MKYVSGSFFSYSFLEKNVDFFRIRGFWPIFRRLIFRFFFEKKTSFKLSVTNFYQAAVGSIDFILILNLFSIT